MNPSIDPSIGPSMNLSMNPPTTQVASKKPKTPSVLKPVPTADATIVGDTLSFLGDATSVIPLVLGGNNKRGNKRA